jgi:phosphoribosyl 1,2-cyclic phosphodiesterase
MRVEIIATGSNGNCVFLQSGTTGILIDAGKWKRDLEKRLNERGINPVTDIQAICITHAHNDHVRGLSLANKYLIPVYATEGEWNGISGVADELRQTLETQHGSYGMVELGDLHIYPFKTHHDAYEPVGYAVEDDHGNRACIVFDTGHIDDDMLQMMEGNIYIVEANHDVDMLRSGDYAESLKARIEDKYRGHLSNDQTAAALAKLIKGRGERIFLTHLSSTNNISRLALLTVTDALRRKGFERGKHYTLEVI